MNHTRLFISLILMLFIAGCGGGSSFDPAPAAITPDSGTEEPDAGTGGENAEDGSDAGDQGTVEPAAASVRIVASLGLINGADVSIAQPDGTVIAGATGTIDATGTVTINHDGSYTGPVLVTVTGNDLATYFDESAGATLPMGPTVVLRAFAPTLQESIGVTILTELAANIIDSVSGAVDADAITAANAAIKDALAPDISDILAPPTIVGEDNITAQALTNSDAGRYALRLAALATMAAGNEAPALSILNQLAADLADGDIDGIGISGALTGLDYEAGTFASLFASAVQLVASTLADTDLVAAAGAISVTIDANVLQTVIDAGVSLPSSVTDLISGDTGAGGDVDISGNYDLTITGEIVTLGIAAPFELRIENIVAPSPNDTAEITQVIEQTVAGVTNITNVQITITSNTADRITFSVSMQANQGGVDVTLNLTYDYVPSSGSSSGDSSSGDASGDNSSSSGDISASAQACSVLGAGAATAAVIPDFISNATRHLIYNEIQAGAPYADEGVHNFVFSSSGLLFVDDVQVASNPVYCNGNEREALWVDPDNNLIYSLSDLTGSFNEVNINAADTGTFLGQFTLN